MSRSDSSSSLVQRTLPVLCCLLVCLPWLPATLRGEILGQDERIGDRANSLWLHWYAAKEWNLSDPFGEVDVFLHPIGIDLWMELFNVVDAFIAMPLVWLFGWGAHYNVLVLLLGVLAVCAGRLWASMWTTDRTVAWLAGLLFAGGSSMVHAVEMGRIVQTGIAVIPFGVWGLHRLSLKATWQRGLIAGLTVGLAGTWYLFWGYGLALCAIFWCSWKRLHKEVGWWVFAATGVCVVALNFSRLDLGYIGQESTGTAHFPALSEAFSPEYYDTAGAIVEGALPIGWVGWSSTHALSICVMVLALVGRWFEHSKRFYQLLFGIVLFVILGMGPYVVLDSGPLMLWGRAWENPLYLELFERLPLVSRMRWLHRWLPFLGVFLLPFAIKGLERAGRWKWIVPLFLLGEWGVKGRFDGASTKPIESQCYPSLERGVGSVLLLPFTQSSRASVFQPVHGLPIVNPIGVSYESSRWPQAYQVLLKEPVFQWAQISEQPVSSLTVTSSVVESAIEQGIGYIVYHKDYLEDALFDPKAPYPLTVDDEARIESITVSLGRPHCSDDQIVVWTVQQSQ